MAAWWTMAEEKASAMGKGKGKRPAEELGHDYRVRVKTSSCVGGLIVGTSIIRIYLRSMMYRLTSMYLERLAVILSSSRDMALASDPYFMSSTASQCFATRAATVRAWDPSLLHSCAISIQRYVIREEAETDSSESIRLAGPTSWCIRDAFDFRTRLPGPSGGFLCPREANRKARARCVQIFCAYARILSDSSSCPRSNGM